MAEVEVDFHKQGVTKEITHERSSQVNCALEDKIREFGELHSFANCVEELGWANEDFVELVSGLKDDNLVSSGSEVEDTINSSEEEKEDRVLDHHEGILNDLFKEEDGKQVLESQGQKGRDEKSAALKTMKKTKSRTATATKCPTKIASTSAEK